MDLPSERAHSAYATLPWLTRSRVVAAFVVYVGIHVVWAYGAPWVHTGFQNAGQFGDMFGALNTFFSGLAMLSVAVAILLQREQNAMQASELALQYRELEDSRKELAGQRKALEAQVARWDKDYIERNKPVVFCDRTEHSDGGFDYVMRNVGGGFAVNVYFLSADAVIDSAGVWPVRALGSLGPNSERRLPDILNRAFCDSANHPLPHLIIAEGAYTRTTQWTATLNYRSADYDPREGHVEHRLATLPVPGRLRNVSLAEFLNNNAEELLRQLATTLH